MKLSVSWKVNASKYSNNLIDQIDILFSFTMKTFANFCLHMTVTEGVERVCVDPGERGTILEAGGVGGPGPPGEGKGGQLASDSGGG